MPQNITIEDVIDGTMVNPGKEQAEWVGSKPFDLMIIAFNKNIDAQFVKGRITGTEYATVYLGGYAAVLEKTLQFMLEVEKIKLSKMPSTLRG